MINYYVSRLPERNFVLRKPVSILFHVNPQCFKDCLSKYSKHSKKT